MVFPWYFHGISMVFPWYFHGISMVFPWYFHGISMVFPWFAGEIPRFSRHPLQPDGRDPAHRCHSPWRRTDHASHPAMLLLVTAPF